MLGRETASARLGRQSPYFCPLVCQIVSETLDAELDRSPPLGVFNTTIPVATPEGRGFGTADVLVVVEDVAALLPFGLSGARQRWKEHIELILPDRLLNRPRYEHALTAALKELALFLIVCASAASTTPEEILLKHQFHQEFTALLLARMCKAALPVEAFRTAGAWNVAQDQFSCVRLSLHVLHQNFESASSVTISLVPGINHEPPQKVLSSLRLGREHQKSDRRVPGIDCAKPRIR